MRCAWLAFAFGTFWSLGCQPAPVPRAVERAEVKQANPADTKPEVETFETGAIAAVALDTPSPEVVDQHDALKKADGGPSGPAAPMAAPVPAAPGALGDGGWQFRGSTIANRSKEQPHAARAKQLQMLREHSSEDAYGEKEALSAEQLAQQEFNREAYSRIIDNPFRTVAQEPLSTFSIDVDTASYANMRRFLTSNQLPPPDAVRIEELVNYFSYNYAPPTDENVPFATQLEVAGCPWNAEHRLVRIGLKGREIALDKRPPSNLVFLVDVSGSMQDENKLPLVQASLRLLVEQLTENDRVAMVVYAGSAGMVLPPTSGFKKDEILSAIDRLTAGGSTNGAGGIVGAYEVARQNFLPEGTNRVILCTDGDFNVGVSSDAELTRLIEDEAKSKVFLSVLGFGTGNYQDAKMEQLADKGNGNYAYVDTLAEGRKVFVEQMAGTLLTIAKDVKIQVEFNPAKVAGYRLVGYENRMLATQDFRDDKKDAGEIGSGHTVTALYEVIPAGKPVPAAEVDPLKYQETKPEDATKPASDELLTVKLRYKLPMADTSTPIEFPLKDEGNAFGKATPDFQFAAAVASFGLVLRKSEVAKNLSLATIREIAASSMGEDKQGYRKEFVTLVEKATALSP